MTEMPQTPKFIPASTYTQMIQRRRALGEAAFVDELVAQKCGREIYYALMRVDDLSTAGRDRLLVALVASADVEHICLAYAHYRGMPEPARNAFIDTVIALGDPHGAYLLLTDKKRPPTRRREKLVEIASTDRFYAGCAKDFSPHITRAEKSILGDHAAA